MDPDLEKALAEAWARVGPMPEIYQRNGVHGRKELRRTMGGQAAEEAKAAG